jgi:predicted porin
MKAWKFTYSNFVNGSHIIETLYISADYSLSKAMSLFATMVNSWNRKSDLFKMSYIYSIIDQAPTKCEVPSLKLVHYSEQGYHVA